MFSVSMPRFVSLSLAISGLFSFSMSAAYAQQVQYSSAHRNAERTLPQTLSGGSKALLAKLAASRSGISLAVADFDRDGTPDLIMGYATSGGGALSLQRGSAAATSPSASDWTAMQRGELVSPFTQAAAVTELPVQPDFLKAVDIDGNGTIDAVVAARGGNSAYVLFGDGKGGFSVPQALPVQGAITALTTWQGPEGTNFIVAGVCGGGGGCGLLVLAADGTVRASIPLPSAASDLQTASLNGGAHPDLVVVAGGSALLIDGDSVLSGAPHTETLPVSGAVTVAAGNFFYDRRGFLQLAVLGSDATLHVLVRAGVDSSAGTRADVSAHRLATRLHPGAQVAHAKQEGMAWSEPETLSSIGSGSGSGTSVMFRTRVTGGGNDDLVVLSGGQFVTVAHPLTFKDGTGKSSPVVTVDSSSKSVTAALPARISPDARFGIIAADGTTHPNIALPPVNKTFTVTTTTDGVHSGTTCTGGAACTIRDAVRLANADTAIAGQSKVDTISIPAGTYTFTTAYNPGLDALGDIGYHYDLDASINVVGAGSASTILNGAGLDKIFSADSSVVNALAPFDVFITGVTMENGTDNNPVTAYNFFGGLIDWESWGPGNLTFNNDILTNGKALNSGGGAIFTSDSNDAQTSATEGLVEVDNTTISNSDSPEQGGGIYLGAGCPSLLNNDTFTGNLASPTVNPSDTDGDGSGGGLFTYGSETTGLTTITNSSFTNNTAVDNGGGAMVYSGMSISGTSFTGNKAGAFGGGLFFGGGPYAGTITSSTFTTNSLVGGSGQVYGGVYQEDGGGICSQSAESGTDTGGSQYGNLTMHYSRIHGNTGGHSTGLGIGCISGADQYATVNATNNWWGCNGAATGTGCDTAIAASPSTQTLTLSPYTELTLSLNTATPAAGTTITATGSLGQDSAGTTYTTAQDAAYLNVPATLTIVQGSSTTNSSASALNSSAAIVTTATTSASGTAKVTVDGTSVSRTFTVSAPILGVTSTHVGNFTAGSTGNTYTLSVANSGNASTSGTVTVVDTLPSGFTATAISGTGWSCTLATLTCTNSTALATSSSLPAITLTVSVSSTDAGVYTNSVAVSGGGAVANSGTDSTIVVGPPTLLEAYTPNTTILNQNVVLSFQFTNPNPTVALTGVSVVDVFPTGLVISTPAGVVNTCGGTVTAAAGSNFITLSGASIAAGANCTLSLDIIATAAGIYVNNTGAPSSSNGGTGVSASAMLTVDGSLWVINANGTVAHLSEAGTLVTTAGTAGTIGTLGAVTYDSAGDVWAVANGTSVVKEFTSTGTAVTVSGNAAAGVNTPTSLAVDGLGQVWVANGNNSVSVLSATGTAVTPTTGYQGGSISTPRGIIIDNSGSVWIPNSGNNSVTKIIGGAAPVVTPTVTGTTNNTLGTRP